MEERSEEDLTSLEAVEEILSPTEEVISQEEEEEEDFSPDEEEISSPLEAEILSTSPIDAEIQITSPIDAEEESISHSEAVEESVSSSRTTEDEECLLYDTEAALQLVVKVLEVPLETIQAVLSSEEGKCVFEKLWKHLSEKNTYETQLLREEHKEEVEELRAQLVESQEMVKMFSVPPSDVPGADRQELLRLLDRRRHEITQLSDEWKTLSSRVVSITAEKSEFQNRLDELMSQEGALKLKEKLMEQEKDLAVTQNEWLSQELDSRSAQLIQLRKERFTSMADLNSQVLAKNEEVSTLTSSMDSLKESYAELEKKAEGYLSAMKTSKEEHAHVEELLRVELTQQARVSDLYKKGSEEAEKRVDELLKAVEKMKALVDDVSKERNELATSLQAENIRSSMRENELASEVDGLRVELSRANDLVASLQRKGGEVLPPLEGISAEVAALFKSGMSATHLYTKFVETMEELAEVKEERQHLLTHFDLVSKELDEKVPALQQLRRDFEKAKVDNNDLTTKLSSLQEEYEILELDSRDSVLLSKSREKEISVLKSSVQDLGRQVKILLREVEDARGGVASTSSYFVQNVDDSDISSSSHVITRELVDFRNVGELQEQNQRLLSVVRELSQQNEELEQGNVQKQTQDLRDQLQLYEEEINLLKESMEKQKELTRSIVNQRDMYRTLLAQATPLPADMSASFSESRRRQSLAAMQVSVGGSDNMDFDPEGVERDRAESATAAAEETKKALEEMKEQFEAYKKEKSNNDAIIQEQMDKLRDESSEVKIDRAKLSSKLEYSKERYSMLEGHHKALKTELDTLRSSNSKLSSALSDHQQRLSSTMNELFSTHEKLSRLEVAHQSLKNSHELLKESERRAQGLYESVCHEKHSQKELLTNLHSIQNKLEMAEFETKTRLGTQVQTLEREVGVLKDQLHAEENRRSTMMDAYESQVRDLTQRLSKTSEGKEDAEERSRDFEQKVASLSTELKDTKTTLETKESELSEVKDKVLRLEQDAGAEFRGKIRLLERKKSDLEESVKSLESQLAASKSHAEEYRNLNLTYEKQIQESNETQQQFRVKMEEEADKLSAEIEGLSEHNSSLETFKRELEEQLQDYTTETSQQVADLEGQIASLESTVATLKVEQQELQGELEAAQRDTKEYSEKVMETEQLYQNELVQHGKSMEELLSLKNKFKETERELQCSQGNLRDLEASVTAGKSDLVELEGSLRGHISSLEERLQQSARENDLLHDESGKLLSRLRIMEERLSRAGGTEGTTSTDSVPSTATQPADLDSSLSDKSMDQLWEIVRFCRHEKELAETRRDLAVTENLRHKQLLESANRELVDCKEQLQRLSESASTRVATAEQHAEILKKVQNLNALDDSNVFLREEKNRLQSRVKEMEGTVEKLEGELQPLQEANKHLTGQKDALVAEKTALRNEVQRWTTRTNQLIEQYNKVDPEEYKKLLEERDNTAAQLLSKAKELESSEAVLAETQNQYAQALVDLQAAQEQERKWEDGEVALKDKIAKLTKDSETQQSLITKLREVGRKHRDQSKAASKTVEEQKEEIAALNKKLEEAVAPSKEPSPTTTNELAEKTKELMEAKKREEKLMGEIQSWSDKFTRAQTTISKARGRLQNLTQEKEQAVKELDEVKGQILSLQKDLKSLESENKKSSSLVTKLQAQLKEKGTISKRKVVVSKLTAHIPSQSTAPTATVKPTVTTTPTASIRPMGIQTTSAPTAHVTPTLVASQQHLLPSTGASQLPSSTTAAATVFVRSTSPQILPPTGSVSPQIQGTEISQPPRSIVNPMNNQSVSSSQALSVTNPTPPGALVPFNEAAMSGVNVRPSVSPVAAVRTSPPTSSPALSAVAPGSPVLMSSESPSRMLATTASLSMTSASDASRPVLTSSGGRVATTVLPFNTQTISPAVISFTTSSDTATVSVSSQASQALFSNGNSTSSSSSSSSSGSSSISSGGLGERTPQAAIERSSTVSRGKVGTSEDQRVQWPMTSTGSMKRKRESEDTEEECVTGAEEDREEPGSSLEPPSSKKRHIRLIQRAQVSPSSSLMPDTQASRKPISGQLDSSQDSPLTSQVLVATTAATTVVVAETTSQLESQSSQGTTDLPASSASSVLTPAAAMTAVVSSPQVSMSSGYGVSAVQSPQPSAGQTTGEEEVEQMEGVAAKDSAAGGQLVSDEVSGSEVAANPNLADSSEEVGGAAEFGDGAGLSGPESSGMAAPSLEQEDKEGVAEEEEMDVAVPEEGIAATEGQEEPTLKPADTTQTEDLQEVLVQDVGSVSIPSVGELLTSQDYTDDDSSRLSEARRDEETERPMVAVEPPIVEPITPIDTTSPPAQLLEDEETQSLGEESATEEGRESEEEEVEEVSDAEEEEEDVEEEEGDDEDRNFKKTVPQPQDDDVIVIGSSSEEEEEDEEEDEEEEGEEFSDMEDEDESGDEGDGGLPEEGEGEEEQDEDEDGEEGDGDDGGYSDGGDEGQVEDSPQQDASEPDQGQYLPEDETSIEIRPMPVQAVQRPTSISSTRRFHSVRFGERQTSIPGAEVPMGDGVVPHTPVLQEYKQLAAQRGAQALPNTPAEQPTNIVPQLTESSLATVSSNVTGVREDEQQMGFVPAGLTPHQDLLLPSQQHVSPVNVNKFSQDGSEEGEIEEDGEEGEEDALAASLETLGEEDEGIEEISGNEEEEEDEEEEGELQDEEEGEIVEEPVSELESLDQPLTATQSASTSRLAPSSTSTTLIRPAASSSSVRVGGAASSHDSGVSTSDLQEDVRLPTLKKIKPSPIVWDGQSVPPSSSITPPSEPRKTRASGRRLVRVARGGQSSGKRRK